MSAVVKWTSPSNLFNPAAFHQMSRLFDDFFAPRSGWRSADEDIARTKWAPVADVKETDKAFLVFVELPGLGKDDIDVSLEQNVLTVSGERRFMKDDNQESYHRLERFYGKFSRSFRLPRNVEPGSVKATFQDGVLALELPKTEEARPRQIKVS